jgi:hypothetical protein
MLFRPRFNFMLSEILEESSRKMILAKNNFTNLIADVRYSEAAPANPHSSSPRRRRTNGR